MSNVAIMKPSDYYFFIIQITLMFIKFVLNSSIPLWLVFSPTILVFMLGFFMASFITVPRKIK